MFQRATKKQSKIRLALAGASGAGKTYSALSIASHLGNSIAVIDTEKGSASKYSDVFEFDVCDLSSYHPTQYIKAIKAADDAGYDVLVVDSLTHAWYAELELAGGNFQNWSKVKPLERALIDAMLSCKAHIIVTMRSKTEYTMQETVNRRGEKTMSPVKVGMAPIQASGIEYEFDVAGDLNLEHVLTITKTRCSDLDNTTHLCPGKELADILLAWVSGGAPASPKIDRSAFMTSTEELMNQLGWSPKDGKAHLQETYGKQSRHYLSDAELQDFEQYLKQLASQVQDEDEGEVYDIDNQEAMDLQEIEGSVA